MIHQTVRVDGKPVAEGKTVFIDHMVQKFEVTIRSISGVGPETIKAKLQEKWEVVSVTPTERTDYVI